MRSSLALVIGSTLLAAACGGSSNGTTGSSGGIATSGGTSTGGRNTTGGTTGGTTTGGASGGLAAGAPCSSDGACNSGICGTDGTGNCCAAGCATTDATCGATACDSAGACTYPATSIACGAVSCTNGTLTSTGHCDGSGTCSAGAQTSCGNYGCADATTCAITCTSSTDCATGFVCNAQACVAPTATGACSENDDCTSGVCGLNGSGNCCTAACGNTADPACDPTACDATGACVYPVGTSCGTPTCVGNREITGACDNGGACQPSPTICPDNLACALDGSACNTSCTTTPDCAGGFFCVADAGTCAAQQAAGPCTQNDACRSNVCGIAGTGNCCAAACANTDPPCGASDCDATTAACAYASSSVLCGSVAESCTGTIQQDPSACDGTGLCNLAPGTTDCTPFICGATACLASCADNTSCGSGDFCDVPNATCCVDLLSDGTATIAVDATNGNDATGCCGIGKAGPCQTITQAMKLIDASGAQNVTINATVGGAGGDWAPANEVYPIVLGWGVELSAPGVYFTDVNGNAEVFDIKNYSANDTVGYASVVGTAASPVWVGMDTFGDQTTDNSAIDVEASNTLFIANAVVNGNVFIDTLGAGTNAITVEAGGTLTLGQDQSGLATGTVTIGGPAEPDGYNGIVCGTANGLGCTITDAALTGISSVIIQNQENIDIDAEDFANISLMSMPVIGVTPPAPGFKQCASKDDAFNFTEAVLLNGAVTMTFDNGSVSCISGEGFKLQATANGSPTLTLDTTTIQNTELGVYASAGTATITNSTIQYNYNGVEQDNGKSTTGTISLGGGGNTVICSNSAESNIGLSGLVGISVLNTTDQTLDASNTTWDTLTPDVFQCDVTLTTCTCEIAACTVNAGDEGMDAVYESTTNNITTTGGAQSGASCALPAACDPKAQTGCPPGDRCCNSLIQGAPPFCVQGNICFG